MSSQDLTTGSIPKHMVRIALPMSIGFFFNTMYNVVDSFYAGTIAPAALTAMAMGFPIFFLILAMSEGLSRGVSVLLSNALGEKNSEHEKAYPQQGFIMALVGGLLVTLLGLLGTGPLLQAIGASGESLVFGKAYLIPLFLGAIFFVVSSICNGILLAYGDTKTFGKVLIVGFFLNLLFNPWFLYGGLGVPAMGIAGIAWATVLIQCLGALYLLSVVIRRKFLVLSSSCLAPQWNMWKAILHQSVPASVNMMSIALGFFITTYFLQFYGEDVVAAFGIGTRIEQIALLPTIGISAAIVALVGQNNGAGKFDRVQETVRTALFFGGLLIVGMSVFLFVFSKQLVGFFTDDPSILASGDVYVRYMAFIQWAYVATFIHVGLLQAMKKPLYGFGESFVRKLLLPLVVYGILAFHLQASIDTFWMGMIWINVGMTLVSIAYGQWKLKQLTS